MNDEEVDQLASAIKKGTYDDELLKEIWQRFLKLRGLPEDLAITNEQHTRLAKAVLERIQIIGKIK